MLYWIPILLAVAPPDAALLRDRAAQAADKVWARAQQEPPPDSLSSRDMFTAALAYCEAGRDLDRLTRLFEVATRMQDRDPASRSYGNLRWSWRDQDVLDYNAVEFGMHAATVLWIRHREKVPREAFGALEQLMRYAIDGCLNHRVPESYTNIALKNAGNLILLGEIFDRADVADEGYARLGRIVIYTWEAGIHEYDSPTYYGVDLSALCVIDGFAQRPEGQQQARALLELFWTDIAANWWPPAQKLAGTRSRDYDYLRGLGYLDSFLYTSGWWDQWKPPGPGLADMVPTYSDWVRPAALDDLSRRYPRYVRQRFGYEVGEAKTHWLGAGVTLGSSAANYGNMDIPLTVDLAGPREGVRGYFIPDGRHDPYGKLKIEAGGGHQKTLHLRPFWTAAQEGRDALGLAIYRDKDVPEDTSWLESHFVLPRAVDELWLGSERIASTQGMDEAVKHGQAVCLRRGHAAVGIQVVWGRDRTGGDAVVRLVDDGNEWGAMRLTVEHAADQTGALPGACFWIRVADLPNPEAFAGWRQAFAGARAEVSERDGKLAIRVMGQDGPVAVTVAAGSPAIDSLVPPPHKGVLAIDGQEVGQPMLERLPRIQAMAAELANQTTVPLPAAGLRWQAEDGLVRGVFVRGQDEVGYVWAPGEPGSRGGGAGAVSWKFQVAAAGTYYLAGRVMAPTADDDSFFLTVKAGDREVVPRSYWPLKVTPVWQWQAVHLDGTPDGPTALELPAGEVELQLQVRENGAKVDELALARSVEGLPR